MACLVAASLPTPALAAPAEGDEGQAGEAGEEPSAKDRAIEAYDAGTEAYAGGEYEEALQLFLEAQSLYPSPDFHYNIAQCHEALGNYKQAIISFQAYLRSSKSVSGEDAHDKIGVENKIQRLEEQLEAQRKADEAEKNKKPEVIIQKVPEEDKKRPGLALMVSGGVLAGVGVGVVVVGGAVFGARAAQLSSQLEDVYEDGNPNLVTLEEARQIDADGRAANLNQALMMSLGSAVAATGVALLVVGVLKKNKAANAPEAEVAPAVGPEGAGLVIRGRF